MMLKENIVVVVAWGSPSKLQFSKDLIDLVALSQDAFASMAIDARDFTLSKNDLILIFMIFDLDVNLRWKNSKVLDLTYFGLNWRQKSLY